jgi:photosystem II stability/assembly factor-like uncharacterized protein
MKNVFGKLVLFLAILVLTSSINAQWRLIPSPTKTNFNSAVQLTDTKAFIVGDNGNMLATNNRGDTWNRIDIDVKVKINSIKFLSDLFTGFIVGDNGVILKTESRWKDFDFRSVATNYFNMDVSFINKLDGIVVGYKYLYKEGKPSSYATILVTHNGGLTWSDNSPNLTGKFNSAIFFDKDNAIAVGNEGLVAITNDCGENWNVRHITKQNLNTVRVCKITGLKIIVGDSGSLFISKDEEKYRWIDYSISSVYNLNSICQKSDGGYVIAGEKIYYLSQDSNQVVPPEIILKQNYTNTGKRIIKRSVILESRELNGFWKEVFTTFTGPFNSVNFCNSNSAIAVGEKGIVAIYKAAFTEDTNWVAPPEKIETQNYPNPFNPSTIISFKLPEQTNVELKVYDVLGNEVATLVNELKPAGNYEAEWNASNLPSGVYIYKLRAGTYTQMKKMLLLK